MPAENLLGELGQGFRYMTSNLAQERLSIAIAAVGAARGALRWTLEYVKQRTAFGATGRHVSELPLRAGRDGHRDRAGDGVLRPGGARAQRRGADPGQTPRWPSGGPPSCRAASSTAASQLHGGYGYMLEYPIARAWVDARVTRNLRRHDRDHERRSSVGRWASEPGSKPNTACTDARATEQPQPSPPPTPRPPAENVRRRARRDDAAAGGGPARGAERGPDPGRAAGVGRTSFYEHFSSKDDVVVKLVRSVSAEMAAEIEPMFELGGSSPEEAFREGLTRLIRMSAPPCAADAHRDRGVARRARSAPPVVSHARRPHRADRRGDRARPGGGAGPRRRRPAGAGGVPGVVHRARPCTSPRPARFGRCPTTGRSSSRSCSSTSGSIYRRPRPG